MTTPRTRSTRPSKLPSASDLPAIPEDVQLTTLDNGLVVIVREDHSAPVVSVQGWCRAGSIHEGNWMGAGLSHVLEHMLFKGTHTRKGAEIDQAVQAVGGYLNAYTSFDRTVYWVNAPNTGATVAIDVICDILQHASLPAADLAKELDVIRREMDMNQDDPGRKSSRRLFEIAYTRSPYRYTIIGYPDIFNRLKAKDIRNYYEAHYAPNNCFLVIVGDVSARKVSEQIAAAYAGSPARPLPPLVLPGEPRQTAAREVFESGDVELGHMHLSWHIPELRDPDIPALDVLSTLLGVGRSSRLYRSVREKMGLAHSVEAWIYSPGNPGLFGASAIVETDQCQPTRAAILREVARLQNRKVTSVELRKAVKQFTAASLSVKKTMQGQANDLGSSWLAADDLNFSARYLQIVQALTPQDLQRVAQQYLTESNRSLYALLPSSAPVQTGAKSVTSIDHPVETLTLPNGLRVLLKEDGRLPFVEIRSAFRGGVLAESEQNGGITSLMARLLIKGTRHRSAEQIADAIESIGGSIDAFAGNNSFGVAAEVLEEDLELGLKLVAESLRSPSFPSPVLERERTIQLASLRAQRDQLLKSAFSLMRRKLYGDKGYGLDPVGTESSLSSLRRQDLQTWHRQLTVPNNGVLAVFGSIDTKTIRETIRRLFARWPKHKRSQSDPKEEQTIRWRHGKVQETRTKQQTVVVVGFPGTTLASPDRQVLDLIQETCSDLGSRLFMRIREKLGLAYYVGAQNFSGVVPGYFAFYAGTEPPKAAKVEREILAETRLLVQEGLTAAELDRAKAKILGQRKIAHQELGNQATSMTLDELYGLGHDNYLADEERYQAVTLAEVKQVAKRYLRPEAAVIATLGGSSK